MSKKDYFILQKKTATIKKIAQNSILKNSYSISEKQVYSNKKENSIFCKKNKASFSIEICPDNPIGDDNGYGSWFGIYNDDNSAFNCQLDNGHWEGIKFNEINDFYEFAKISELITNISNEKHVKLVNEIAKDLVKRLNETLIHSLNVD